MIARSLVLYLMYLPRLLEPSLYLILDIIPLIIPINIYLSDAESSKIDLRGHVEARVCNKTRIT